MKILLIEDDAEVREFIREGLEFARYHTDLSANGIEGLELGLVNRYDIIILDYMLPGMNGLEVLKQLRKEGCRTKIIMLTANDTLEDKVNCLNSGADDYLVKPFAFPELLARLRVLMRRQSEAEEDVLTYHDLSLNLRSNFCKRAEKEITLTTLEFMLLEYFIRRAGEVISRNELLELVWGKDDQSDSNKIEVYIFYLRNKIDKGFDVPLLHTVRGRGYQMKYDKN